MEKITTDNISSGVKLAAAIMALLMSVASGFASYAVMSYRVTELEKLEATRNSDHEKVILIENDLKYIKDKTASTESKVDDIYRIVIRLENE